jgi:hypothetical protein
MVTPPLRELAEVPLHVVSVVINLAVIASIVHSAWALWWLPDELRDTTWADGARAGPSALLLPALVLSRAQFPEDPRVMTVSRSGAGATLRVRHAARASRDRWSFPVTIASPDSYSAAQVLVAAG